MALNILAQKDEAAAVTDAQKQAVEELKNLAVCGNQEAASVLNQLRDLPEIHPLLKEVLVT